MKVNKRIASVVVLGGLLVGSLGAGFAMSPRITAVNAAPVSQTQPDQPPVTLPEEDDVQDPGYTGSIRVDEAATEGMSEADEAAALQGQATVSAEQAQAAAEAANPGATATEVKLDNENGVLVYSVELDNGLDVKIDAGAGTVLHTEQDDADDNEGDDNDADGIEGDDIDDVQEEHEAENEADDATETEGATEDAPETAPSP